MTGFEGPGPVPDEWGERWLEHVTRPTPTEQTYRGLVEAMPSVGIVLDAEGTLLQLLANDHNQGLFAEDPASIVGQTVFDVFSESKAERFHETIRETLETGAVQTIDYELSVNDGARQFRGYVAPIPGETPRVVWIAEDVTATVEPERWFERLTDIVTDPDRDFEAKLQAVFDLGCERFDLEIGAVARVAPDDDEFEVEYASESDGYFAPGTTLSLSETFCTALANDDGPVCVTAAVDGAGAEFAERAVHDDFGLETYLGTHIEVESGDDRTFFFASAEARETSLRDDERLFLELLGQWVTYELGRELSAERERRIEAIFDQAYQFTGLLDPDGTLREANRTALEFGGLDRADVVGEKLWDTDWFRHSEETRERARSAVRRAADGDFVRHELRVQGAEREAVIDFSVRPVTDDDGEVTLVIPEGRDITERKRHEERFEALNDATRRLWVAEDEREIAETTVEVAESVLDEHLVAMWSYDERTDELVPLAATDDASILDEAADAEDAFGAISPDTVEMRVFRGGETRVFEDYQRVDPPAHPETELRSLLLAPLGEHGQLYVGSTSVGSFDGSTRELIETLAKNAEAALERQTRERDLEQSRDRLSRTERLADVGGWELDVRTNSLTWTDGTRRIFEVPDDFEPTLQGALGFFHPEDTETIARAVERCRDEAVPYTVEVRLVSARGHERWVEVTGEAAEQDGSVVRLRGAIRDITDRKEREQQLSVLYRILRHNLRNDLNIVRGFSQALDSELDRLEPPAAVDGREREAFEGIVDALPEAVGEDLDGDVEGLRATIEELSALSLEELSTHRERVDAATSKLASIGDKATRLHELIVTEGDEPTQQCRVAPTVETVLEDYRETYPRATFGLDATASGVVEDTPGKLSLALGELLENAVEHSQTDAPTVAVRTVGSADSQVTIEVEDRGPGVPDSELAALRQDEENQLVHGSGFGLWLVDWLASHLGGQLCFETDDTGTVASLALPTVEDRVAQGPGSDG